jgi:hypothetical protein
MTQWLPDEPQLYALDTQVISAQKSICCVSKEIIILKQLEHCPQMMPMVLQSFTENKSAI